MNEHGDFFWLHNFGVQIVPFKLAKKLIQEKKRYGQKRPQSPLLDSANYDFESNYSNVLSLKLRDFFTNYNQIVPYARDFLSIKFCFLF